MWCAVCNCRNNNDKIVNCDDTKSFHRFPTDAALLKVWLFFCKRKDKFNVKTARICSEHFVKEDYGNYMQHEMGLADKLHLKKGAVPSIYQNNIEQLQCQSNRNNRMVARTNKGIISSLLVEPNQCTITEDADSREMTINADEENKELVQKLQYLQSEFDNLKMKMDIVEVDADVKPEILNFVPVEGNDNIEKFPTIQIKSEVEDPLHPFNEGYYFIQCKCSVLVKRSDKSVQCNLYEEQIEPHKISISNIEENSNNIINTDNDNVEDYVIVDNYDTVDSIIAYSSLSETSSEDEVKFEDFAKTDKVYEEAYTMVDGGYKCGKCDKILGTRSRFLRHSVSHQEYSRLCYGCGKIYTEPNHRHLKACPSLNKENNEGKDNATGYKRRKRNSFENLNCKDCGTIIKSVLERNDHQNLHKNLKPYLCSCGSKCRYFDNFVIHLKKFKCPVDKCIIPKYAPQNIQRWLDREPNDQYKYRRTPTDKGQSGSILQLNIRTRKKKCTTEERRIKLKKLPDSELNCKECGIDKFLNYVRYREHLEVKHLDKIFECKDKRCDSKFATERRLREHVKNYHLLQYKCEKCNFVFSKQTYKRHTLTCSGLNNENITLSNYKTTFRNQLFYCSICTEYEEHWKIVRHFSKDYHKNLEKTWKEKYNIKEYKCTKCKKLSKLTKNNIYYFFMHLAKKHEYCFILQINDIFKSFENNEPFLFNVDAEDSNLRSIAIYK